MKLTLHVALVSAYPDEHEARLEIGTGEPYRGTWVHPTPDGPLVHVFSDATAEQLEAAGWTREDT